MKFTLPHCLFLLSFVITTSSLTAQENKCFEGCWAQLDSKAPEIGKANYILKGLVGCKVPGFRITTLVGKVISSEELRGKVVVWNFWYESCAPCIAELPSLNRLAEEYAKKDVVFIAFGKDSPYEIEQFLSKRPFKYQHTVLDENGIKALCVLAGYPTNMVIDKEGILRFADAGAIVSDSPEDALANYRKMTPVIDKYLGE